MILTNNVGAIKGASHAWSSSRCKESLGRCKDSSASTAALTREEEGARLGRAEELLAASERQRLEAGCAASSSAARAAAYEQRCAELDRHLRALSDSIGCELTLRINGSSEGVVWCQGSDAPPPPLESTRAGLAADLRPPAAQRRRGGEAARHAPGQRAC